MIGLILFRILPNWKSGFILQYISLGFASKTTQIKNIKINYVYTFFDLKWDKSTTKNQKGLPVAARVNFGFGNSSKLLDELLLLDK
jgi:hypothetical protein